MILAEVMIGLSVLREGNWFSLGVELTATLLTNLCIWIYIFHSVWFLGGHFVIRFYDMFTPFTVGLVFLLYQLFETVVIHKPETTLYASAERYVICKGKKVNRYVREVINYLMECQKFYKNTQRM